MAEASLDVKQSSSDKNGYLYKLTINYSKETYFLYVKNQKATNNSKENEVKDIVKYNGDIFYRNKKYSFESIKKTETEIDEQEEKIELKIYDEKNVILIQHSFENDLEENEREEKFSINITKNSILLDSFFIKREENQWHNTIKVGSKNNPIYKCEFKNNKEVYVFNGKHLIGIFIKNDDGSYSLKNKI